MTIVVMSAELRSERQQIFIPEYSHLVVLYGPDNIGAFQRITSQQQDPKATRLAFTTTARRERFFFFSPSTVKLTTLRMYCQCTRQSMRFHGGQLQCHCAGWQTVGTIHISLPPPQLGMHPLLSLKQMPR